VKKLMNTPTTAEQDEILRRMWADPSNSAAAIGAAAGRDAKWVMYRRAKLGLPPRRPGQVACPVRDRAMVLKESGRRSWGSIADECGLDPEEVKRWADRWTAGSPELLEAMTRWCDGREGVGPGFEVRPDLAALLPVLACSETVMDWLYAELLRQGCKHHGAMERISILTEVGLYREANVRRLAYGLPPFVAEEVDA
jgi:hypothetical protein